MSLDTSLTTQDALSVIVQNYNAIVGPARAINDVDYAFSLPAVDTTDTDPLATILTVTPAVISAVSNRVKIKYQRISLAGVTPLPVLLTAGAVNVSDVIGQIANAFGITLGAADYVEAPLEPIGVTQWVSITTSSLLFVGTIPFVLQSA